MVGIFDSIDNLKMIIVEYDNSRHFAFNIEKNISTPPESIKCYSTTDLIKELVGSDKDRYKLYIFDTYKELLDWLAE